jgi:hypothetical protein
MMDTMSATKLCDSPSAPQDLREGTHHWVASVRYPKSSAQESASNKSDDANLQRNLVAIITGAT